MKYAELTHTFWPIVIGCWILALFWFSLLLFAEDFREKKTLPLILRNALYFIFVTFLYLLFQCVAALQYRTISNRPLKMLAEIFGSLPLGTVIFICSVITLYETGLHFYNLKWRKTHITDASIKEAVDSLPAGVVIYNRNGKLKLKNTAMEALSRSINGAPLLNGIRFEEAVFSKMETDAADSILLSATNSDLKTDTSSAAGNRRILALPNGTVQSINKSVISYGSHTYSMLTASDVTEEYVRTKILNEKREAVRRLNIRLNDYNREILSVITAREILNAKIRIHDELGAGLLQIKNYLQNGGDAEERESIKKRITGNAEYLKEESKIENPDEYELITNTASALGVSIRVEGKLPDSLPNRHIIATALHECFTNTLRYAKGNRLNICVSEAGDCIHAELTNNGLPPQKEITEKGGLSSLRNLTEQAGGTMRIQSFPVFTLFINLPKETDGFENKFHT